MNNHYLLTFNLLTFLENVKKFISSLTIIDIVFFFSVVLLLILIITLLYFIKANEDYIDNSVSVSNDDEPVLQNTSETLNNFNNESINNNYINEEPLVSHNYTNHYDDEEGELLDLETITKALENKTTNAIDLTAFEEEQEKEAIISYDELINKAKPHEYSYKKESIIDGLSVKEVDLESLNNNSNAVKQEIVNTVSYEEEEAFLEALKQLQKQIN